MAINRSEEKKCLKIAHSIVRSQGSIFIRELLREKQKSGVPVKIGLTKEASLENLYEAIRHNLITLKDLQDWVNQVEGWGRQHVYLYALPEPFDRGKKYGSNAKITKAIQQSRYSNYLDKVDDFGFPNKLKLRQIVVDKSSVEIIWKQRTAGSVRDDKKDPPNKKIDGDDYEFRAYRVIPARSVMRFLFRPKEKIVALFIQLPLGKDHFAAFTEAEKVVKEIFQPMSLKRLEMSKVIKKLDSLGMKKPPGQSPNLEAHTTKFTAQGASVEFSADSSLTGWKQVTSVRRVRKSLDVRHFDGDSGSFNVHLTDVQGTKRTIQMLINGKRGKDRIYFRAQMTAEEVLKLLGLIEKYAR